MLVLAGGIPQYWGKCKCPKMQRKNHKSKGKTVYDVIPGHYRLQNIDEEPRLIFIFYAVFVAILRISGVCFFLNQISATEQNRVRMYTVKKLFSIEKL